MDLEQDLGLLIGSVMPQNVARQRGIAIILVITVLMALVLVGTPFVLSMILQEETSVVQKEQRQSLFSLSSNGEPNL